MKTIKFNNQNNALNNILETNQNQSENCQGCEMPKCETSETNSHLVCAGCKKICDNGATRENDYYTFRGQKWGAYVFRKMNGEPVEEWYCSTCKFELLCGDCGSPHELGTKLPLGDFDICGFCRIERHEKKHEENHTYEPNLNCRLCEEWLEKYQERKEEKPSENLQRPQVKSYPIKEFLLSQSYLVEFDEKEASGRLLSQIQIAKQRRIYDLRDKTFDNIHNVLAKYYDTVIKGDYRFDGMPQITYGIRGWAEDKIWQLLVLIGEPNHLHYKSISNDYWAEK